MLTTAQAVSTKTEELANKLHDDICESFADSGHFKDDSLIVTPVTPIYDQDTNEIKAYGFWVYFDAEEFDDDVIVNVLKRAKESWYFNDEPAPKYACESPTGEFFTDQDVKKHLAEMDFEVF